MKSTNKKFVINIIKQVIDNLLLLGAALLLVYVGYMTYVNKDNPENTYIFNYKPIYVMTGSMEPTLMVNGMVIIEKIDYNDVQVDDIITYKIDDKFITHRVIEITENGVRTKGDNNNVQDAYTLKEEHIKAKVVLIMNWTADIVDIWNAPMGKFKCIGLPIIIILIIFSAVKGIQYILKTDTTDKKENKNEKENK